MHLVATMESYTWTSGTDECAVAGATVYTEPVEIDLPGRGNCRAMIVRNPGSGELQELFQVAQA